MRRSSATSRYHWGGQYFIHGPRLMEYLSEMNREVLSKGDILTVGEAVMATTEHAIDLTNEETGHLNMLFQFEHMDLDRDPGSMSAKWALKRWDLLDLKRVMTRWQTRSGRQGLEQPVPVQPRPAALRFPLRRRRPLPRASRPSCWAPSCTCSRARPMSTRARRSA